MSGGIESALSYAARCRLSGKRLLEKCQTEARHPIGARLGKRADIAHAADRVAALWLLFLRSFVALFAAGGVLCDRALHLFLQGDDRQIRISREGRDTSARIRLVEHLSIMVPQDYRSTGTT